MEKLKTFLSGIVLLGVLFTATVIDSSIPAAIASAGLSALAMAAMGLMERYA